jgi:hypothetical protein
MFLILGIAVLLCGHGLLAGCDRERVTAPELAPMGLLGSQGVEPPPDGLVTVGFSGRELTFWPYTSKGFDGVPSDPINLIFVGKADPLRIRAALLSLDGDRTAFGLPAEFPLNATWREADGGAQTCYADGGGWLGSVIQLELGSYESVRLHLRLFGTGVPWGEDGEWVVAGAHLDARIPGTADHQVLSWEVPEQIVIVDLIRSGLLDPQAPMVPTAIINQAPAFREIPEPIYNGLPPALVALIQGPAPPVTGSVPIPNDGRAMILNLEGTAPVVPGRWVDELDLEYGQVIPKPFCMSGPSDWVQVTGPVHFTKRTTVTRGGRYGYVSHYRGVLTVVPVDIRSNPPVPMGEPFQALVSGNQTGGWNSQGFLVRAQDRRIAPQERGAELQIIRLAVNSGGVNEYREMNRCLDAAP